MAVNKIMASIDAEDHVVMYNFWQKVRTEIENL